MKYFVDIHDKAQGNFPQGQLTEAEVFAQSDSLEQAAPKFGVRAHATGSTIDVTSAIEQAPFGPFQLMITALCAWIALLDGFDTQAIAYVAPVIAEQWQINMAGFGPIFGIGLAGLTLGAFVLGPAADQFPKVIMAAVLGASRSCNSVLVMALNNSADMCTEVPLPGARLALTPGEVLPFHCSNIYRQLDCRYHRQLGRSNHDTRRHQMFIAMNRFRVTKGSEAAFENVWLSRDSHLDKVPGFVEFHLLKGPEADDHTLYASHTVWKNRAAFEAWTKSEAFRAAHHKAGDNKPLYLGHPQFEGFETIQTVGGGKAAVA